MILTAHIADDAAAFFNALRREHFPPARNFLGAHLTVFHNISDRHLTETIEALRSAALMQRPMRATSIGVRHLGRGVAFEIDCPDLSSSRRFLRQRFEPWLVPQDLQGWRPHITVQNGVAKIRADELHKHLSSVFQPRMFEVTGLDLWHYRGGPWQAEASFEFSME